MGAGKQATGKGGKRKREMKCKRDQRLKRMIKRADIESRQLGSTPVTLDPVRYNRLDEQLRRAEESGDMVKQNLIMEEMAKLETGWDWI